MIDLFIIVVLIWAVYSGWKNGLIKELASGVGILFGLMIAATCYKSFGNLLIGGENESHGVRVFSFFFLWVFSPLVLGLLANLLTRMLNSVHLGGINRAGGSLLSAFKFTILLSCLLNVMSFLGLLTAPTEDSRFYEPVKGLLGSLADDLLNNEVINMDKIRGGAHATDQDTVWIDVNDNK